MKHVLIFFIDMYKKIISPWLPNSCRFYPTCSEYSRQAIEKYGAIKGGLMAAWRIMRCNPWNKGGIDHVK